MVAHRGARCSTSWRTATAPAASELARDLVLDAGYVSRILRRFEAAGLIERQRDAGDARRSHLLLTAIGRESFAALDTGTRTQIARLLDAAAVARARRRW